MYFPPAFQVLSLALLAAFGWSANLLLLARAGIAARPILQLAQLPLTHGDADGVDVRLHRPIARLATVLSGIALVGWCLCALSATATARAAIILLTYLAIAAALLMPRRVLCHIVRMQFVALLVRIVKPSLSDPVFLADIVMADILTSCARLFSDLFVVVCQLVAILGHGDAAGSARSGRIGTLLVCAPYAFRLRQCINECLKADPKSGDARRHLANAVKYASSFP
ncbi:protein-ER retention protein, partial [Coemansia sp. RSA 552]